jgi:hypothetical protein
MQEKTVQGVYISGGMHPDPSYRSLALPYYTATSKFHDSLDHSTGSVTAIRALTLGGVSVCTRGSSNASTAFLLDEDDSSFDFFSGS